MPTPHLSSTLKGILQAPQDGDLDAFPTAFPFSLLFYTVVGAAGKEPQVSCIL